MRAIKSDIFPFPRHVPSRLGSRPQAKRPSYFVIAKAACFVSVAIVWYVEIVKKKHNIENSYINNNRWRVRVWQTALFIENYETKYLLIREDCIEYHI